MMRKLILILIAVAAVAVGAGVALQAMRSEREWTTASRAALQAFEEGVNAERKLYLNEAREHFARAVELDPEFTMARLKLLTLSTRSPDRPKRIREFILDADLDRLTPRERFLLRHRLALIDRDMERADQLVAEFLAERPNDPYALSIRCERAWGQNDLDAAEQCYTKLLELDPHAVLAQNHLGYIRMSRGDFAGAEEAFAAYGRIAPDQANPHDSLGELLMLTGRYEEAEREFEHAVSIRSDFCASWAHLIDLALLQGDPARAEQVLARAGDAVCPPEFSHAQRCRVAIWRGAESGSAETTARLAREAGCAEADLDAVTLAILYASALASGDSGTTGRIESGVAKWLENYRAGSVAGAIDGHMRGLRLANDGSLPAAIAAMRDADSRIGYNGGGVGIFKMYNRMSLAALLEQSGAARAAADLRAEVRHVNPPFADRFAAVPLVR